MAKKGGVQQLQADIQTDEEFERFIEKPGLLVLDVYSEWCGPCLGMVGSLRKIKLELGGDNLQLAICKADTISYLKRFQKKSEPTWMFIHKGKSINLLFGTNVPQLMKLITVELERLNKPHEIQYQITEMHPEEVKRRKLVEDAAIDAKRKEQAAKDSKRHGYLTHVTDTIIENMPDMGVTIFGPQVSRDMYKKILEPAEAMKLQCKDRRVITVNKSDFDVVNYSCPNPLPEDVLEQFDQKELMMCFWKMPDDDRRPIPDILNSYAHELTKKRIQPADEYNEVERDLGPIIAPLDLTIEIELGEDEEWEEEPEPEPEPIKKPKKSVTAIEEHEEAAQEMEEDEEEEDEEGEAGDAEPIPDMDLDLDFDLDKSSDIENEEAAEEEVEAVEPVVVKRYRKKVIRLPAVWVANNARTHAAIIYTFFHQQTSGFLAPDPIPEPPHVIMAFDAYKKRDLMSMAERYKDDVPLFGFFTSDDVHEAQYISNSSEKYGRMPQNPDDKLIFKVNKQTSNTMLAFATYGPSYVSANTEIGREEALKLFPSTFRTAAQEAIEEAEKEAAMPKSKRKTGTRKTLESYETAAPHEQKVIKAAESVEGSPPTPSEVEDGEKVPPTDDEAAQLGEEGATPTGEDGTPTEGGEAPAETSADVPEEAIPEPPAEATPEPPAEAPSESPAPPEE